MEDRQTWLKCSRCSPSLPLVLACLKRNFGMAYLPLRSTSIADITSRRANRSVHQPRTGLRGLLLKVINNYWQTRNRLWEFSLPNQMEDTPHKLGSAEFPDHSYQLVKHEREEQQPVAPDRKGDITIVPPLPPPALTTITRGDDARFVKTLFLAVQRTSRFTPPVTGPRTAPTATAIMGAPTT